MKTKEGEKKTGKKKKQQVQFVKKSELDFMEQLLYSAIS